METPNEPKEDLAYCESFSAWLDHNHDAIDIQFDQWLEANGGMREEDQDAING